VERVNGHAAVPGKAVEFVNDDDIEMSCLGVGEHLPECRAFGFVIAARFGPALRTGQRFPNR
jgi:hypothetical protein